MGKHLVNTQLARVKHSNPKVVGRRGQESPHCHLENWCSQVLFVHQILHAIVGFCRCKHAKDAL